MAALRPAVKKAAASVKQASVKQASAKEVSGKKASPKKAPAKKAPGGSGGGTEIRSWEDDPGEPASHRSPVLSPAPMMDPGSLPVGVAGRAPTAQAYEPATPEFRFWAAAEALGRAAGMWSQLLPAGVTWYRSVGSRLQAFLDEGEDFNAYYDRHGLKFFHGTAAGVTVYSGESPDVVCHELGHAVLDALRPQLFGTAFAEVAAFHESFGDMSAMLSDLQLKSVRSEVLAETGQNVYRSSRLSRLAEQLGWAIRQIAPDAVEGDCLRNAVNSFFYQDPATLPPRGPAGTLSSEPHSFSRVFTASFLQSIAGMFLLQPTQDEQGLLAAGRDAALLLVDAAGAAPVVPTYYSQVAAHMIAADAQRNQSRYSNVLKAAFAKHGVLSLDSVNTLRAPEAQAAAAPMAELRAVAPEPEVPALVAIPGARYGLGEDLLVQAPAEPKRFSVMSAGPDITAAEAPAHDRAAQSFVEDLFRRGDVRVEGQGVAPARPSSKTHAVERQPEGLVLVRLLFD